MPVVDIPSSTSLRIPAQFPGCSSSFHPSLTLRRSTAPTPPPPPQHTPQSSPFLLASSSAAHTPPPPPAPYSPASQSQRQSAYTVRQASSPCILFSPLWPFGLALPARTLIVPSGASSSSWRTTRRGVSPVAGLREEGLPRRSDGRAADVHGYGRGPEGPLSSLWPRGGRGPIRARSFGGAC